MPPRTSEYLYMVLSTSILRLSNTCYSLLYVCISLPEIYSWNIFQHRQKLLTCLGVGVRRNNTPGHKNVTKL